jgi:hypothetical protein
MKKELALKKFKYIMIFFVLVVGLHAFDARAQVDAPQSPGPGWVWVGDRQNLFLWLHLPSRVRNGSIVGAWIIANLKEPRNLAYGVERSNRMHAEYNCQTRNWRVRIHTAHSSTHAMDGSHIYTYSNHPSPWEAVPPNGLEEKLMTMACRL